MKCQILFPEKNRKNISICRLLKILPRVLNIKALLLLKGLNTLGRVPTKGDNLCNFLIASLRTSLPLRRNFLGEFFFPVK